jgi:6-phosphogluconolactonase (cycloisomerase 2 family)
MQNYLKEICLKALRSVVIVAAVAALAACPFTLKYPVGGVVVGLHGSGLVLEDNLRDDLSIAQSGAFTFSSAVAKDSAYSVTVKTQPTNPAQTCSVRNGSGTISNVTIANVIVTCTQAGRYAYVANQTANTVSAFLIDSAGRAFLALLAAPYAAGTTPVAVAVDPNGAYLYAVNYGSNSVLVYAIDDTTGLLTPQSIAFGVGTGPAAIAIHPSAQFIYVANSGSNSVSAFRVESGTATPVAGSPYAVGNQPSALAIDPNGNFLYVTNYTDGTVSAFAIDTTTGALTAFSGAAYAAGVGPVAIALAPAGFAYVANAGAGSISWFTWNSTSGALAPISGTPTATTTSPESLVVDPSGSYLYAANVPGNNAVTSYGITASTGALTLSSSTPGGAAALLPLSLAVDPAGGYVYSANQTSGTVSVYSVDPTTGALAAVSGSPFASGGGSRSIAID